MDKIYICTKDEGNHYIFKCLECNKEYELITENGRYGNLGPFECSKCGKKYYATIDDHINPSSMFDNEGKKRSIEIKNNGLGMY